LPQRSHNSKFVIFQEKILKVLKCYNFLWVQRRHNCSPAASFCKLRYDTIPVKSASANVSFYTSNSKYAKFWFVTLLSQISEIQIHSIWCNQAQNLFSFEGRAGRLLLVVSTWTLLRAPFVTFCAFLPIFRRVFLYNISVSQNLWDRGPVNPFFIRRGPGPNKFTPKYLSILFKFIH